jgi:ABC-type protease/lipase transport system fused ATPase/permease subunit
LFYISQANLFFDIVSAINISIADLTFLESYYLPVFLFSQFLFLLFVLSIFILFYFSFFNSASKEENTVDFDFLAASLTVEAEKEITAIDDILMGLVIVVYIFF